MGEVKAKKSAIKKAAKKAAKKAPVKKSVSKKAVSKKVEKKFAFGIDDLAKDLGIASATVRIKLRKADYKPQGRSYGWNETDYKKVVKDLKKD